MVCSSHARFADAQRIGSHRSSKSTRHKSSSRALDTLSSPRFTTARNAFDAHCPRTFASLSEEVVAVELRDDANAFAPNVSASYLNSNASPCASKNSS
jgi:hypothetical protein